MEQHIASSSDREHLSANEFSCKFAEAVASQHDQTKNVDRQESVDIVEEEDEGEDENDYSFDLTGAVLAENGYGKTALSEHVDVGNEEFVREDDHKVDDRTCDLVKIEPPNNTPITRPSDRKLVSALKGSREKEHKHKNNGFVDTKIRVTWAPDVHDPPPSAERLVQDKTKKKKNKKKEEESVKKDHKSAKEDKGKGKRKGKDKYKKQG